MEAIPGLIPLAWITLVAAITPIIVGLMPAPRPPEVVILLIGGMVIGPYVLELVPGTDDLELLVNLGLGFLFFVAGSETDLRILRRKPGKLAMWAWGTSVVAALVAAVAADLLGWVAAPFPVAIAMTTTALGTLLPIIKDNGVLDSPLGSFVVAGGAVGEFAPLLAISVFLGSSGFFGAFVALALVGGVAAISLLLPGKVSDKIKTIISRGESTSSQTLLRWTVVLLLALLAVSMKFGLDIVIGAFAAGIVLRLHQQMGHDPTQQSDLIRKVEGMAFGFFIPVFFVTSGVTLDLPSIIANPIRLLAFFVAILVIRGVPTFLIHRRAVPDTNQRLRLMLYIATGLPVIIAITTIGLANGTMLPENATALVGAGVLTVLFFPLAAELLSRRNPAHKPAEVGTIGS